MMLRRVMLGVAGAAISVFSPLALAQVTPAMDRMPADALVVATIKNLDQFNTEISNLARMLRLPADALTQLGEMGQLLRTEGVRADGSAAFAILPGGEDGERPPMVMLLPVTDYQSLVRTLGGTPTAGIDLVEIEGEDVFVKSLDGGFAAASPDQDVLGGFQGAAGSRAAFEQMLGPAGKAVAERADIYFVANIPALQPQIQEGIEVFEQQLQMMAMMAPGGQQPNTEAIKALVNDLARDARAAVFGLDISEQGLSLGFGAQFGEGSTFAGYFQAPGNAHRLIASLPNQPYLATYAMDVSSPGIKSLLKRMAAMQGEGQNPMFGPMQVSRFVDTMDGMSFFWGTTPALMGGIFLNTFAFIQTADPDGYIAATKKTMEDLNKQTLEGVTFQTAYQSGGAKVGNREVDVWTMKMQADPTSPNAQQVAQMQMMMFGPSGLSGYAAKTDKGVVMTYSKNSSLLEQAITSIHDGRGLNEDAGVQKVAGQLPENRSFAAYIGIRNILEIGIGFAGMMGGPVAMFEVPQELPPIGFGATTDGGGIAGRLFVPNEVMVTIKELVDTFQGEMDEDDEDIAPATGQPRF
jgi:hypothetical protein